MIILLLLVYLIHVYFSFCSDEGCILSQHMTLVGKISWVVKVGKNIWNVMGERVMLDYLIFVVCPISSDGTQLRILAGIPEGVRSYII